MSSTNIEHKRHANVHYGEDFVSYSTDWDNVIGDSLWAIEEGYLDAHLGALVAACITRRRHLAEHGAVPPLTEPGPKTALITYAFSDADTVGQAAADAADAANGMSLADLATRDLNSLRPVSRGLRVEGRGMNSMYVNPDAVDGKLLTMPADAEFQYAGEIVRLGKPVSISPTSGVYATVLTGQRAGDRISVAVTALRPLVATPVPADPQY